MVENVPPTKVWEALRSDPKAQLVDVRTDAEWNFVGLPDLSSVGKQVVPLQWQLYPTNPVSLPSGLSPVVRPACPPARADCVRLVRGGDAGALPWRLAPDPRCIRLAMGAAGARLPCHLLDHRLWPERVSHSGPSRRRHAADRSAAARRRRSVRPDVLQAAFPAPRAGRAGGRETLGDHRQRGGNRRAPGRPFHRRLRPSCRSGTPTSRASLRRPDCRTSRSSTSIYSPPSARMPQRASPDCRTDRLASSSLSQPHSACCSSPPCGARAPALPYGRPCLPRQRWWRFPMACYTT